MVVGNTLEPSMIQRVDLTGPRLAGLLHGLGERLSTGAMFRKLLLGPRNEETLTVLKDL